MCVYSTLTHSIYCTVEWSGHRPHMLCNLIPVCVLVVTCTVYLRTYVCCRLSQGGHISVCVCVCEMSPLPPPPPACCSCEECLAGCVADHRMTALILDNTDKPMPSPFLGHRGIAAMWSSLPVLPKYMFHVVGYLQ